MTRSVFPEGKTLLSRKEIAAAFNVPYRTILHWAYTGRLPKPVRLSRGTLRYSVDDLEAFLAERRGA